MNKTNVKKKVVIIGAGPGGLSAAMLLAHYGHAVTVVEEKSYVGGRNSSLKIKDYVFDLGPTFIMLPDVFKETFKEVGLNIDNYINLKRLDIMYRLHYADGRDFNVYFDKEKIKQEIDRLFPGEAKGYEKYLAGQKIQFDRLYKCLTVPYLHWYNYLRSSLIKALPIIRLGKSVHNVLSAYFKNDDLKIAMAFQAKYLGMSPWKCPGGFSILSYVEHAFGIYHAMGGVHQISAGLTKAAKEKGAEIKLDSKVKSIILEGRKACGVELENGEKILAEAVVMNADFAYGMTSLIDEKLRKKYSNEDLKNREYSCSTFMIYLGLDKRYDITHNNIFFSADYKTNVEAIYKTMSLPEDPSFYIQNASATDSSLAPEGKSTIYILVPVPNLKASIDWEKEKDKYRELVLSLVEKRTELKDIRQHIEVEKVITPLDWQKQANVFAGAVFNLAHSLGQMLYLRPRNKLEGYENLYIVGGGTHPGSGLPTIVESGRIVARLINQ